MADKMNIFKIIAERLHSAALFFTITIMGGMKNFVAAGMGVIFIPIGFLIKWMDFLDNVSRAFWAKNFHIGMMADILLTLIQSAFMATAALSAMVVFKLISIPALVGLAPPLFLLATVAVAFVYNAAMFIGNLIQWLRHDKDSPYRAKYGASLEKYAYALALNLSVMTCIAFAMQPPFLMPFLSLMPVLLVPPGSIILVAIAAAVALAIGARAVYKNITALAPKKLVDQATAFSKEAENDAAHNASKAALNKELQTEVGLFYDAQGEDYLKRIKSFSTKNAAGAYLIQELGSQIQKLDKEINAKGLSAWWQRPKREAKKQALEGVKQSLEASGNAGYNAPIVLPVKTSDSVHQSFLRPKAHTTALLEAAELFNERLLKKGA